MANKQSLRSRETNRYPTRHDLESAVDMRYAIRANAIGAMILVLLLLALCGGPVGGTVTGLISGMRLSLE